MLAFKQDELEPFRSLRAGLEEETGFLGKTRFLTRFLEQLAAWETFLDSPVDRSNPIPFLRNALDKAFGYHAYQDDVARRAEVDDLTARRVEVRQAEDFFRHRDRVRAVARYANLENVELPDEPALAGVRATFQKARASLERLDELLASEARLLSELLEPAEWAIQSYSVRYLQVFDQVTAHAEQVRQQIEALPDQPAFRALDRLARVEQLGSDPCPGVRRVIDAVLDEPSQFFPTTLTRAEVERRLRHRPQPQQCSLTLQNGDEWRQKADVALAHCQDTLQTALLDKAALLHSDALRDRLAQGRNEPFIAGLLEAQTVEEVAEYLRNRVFSEKPGFSDEPINLLTRYLKKLRVRRLRLTDFSPSKRTIERADVDKVVTEFRTFLLDGLAAEEDELPVVELG